MKHNPIPKNEASGAGNFFKKKLSFLADLCYNWAYVFKIEKVRKLNADRINDRRSRENR